MKPWCLLLPVWFVRWWSLRNCERFHDTQYDATYVSPFRGVRFYIDVDKFKS